MWYKKYRRHLFLWYTMEANWRYSIYTNIAH